MRRIDFFVVHYSASPDVSASVINLWHTLRGFRSIGYHKVIRKDGRLEEGRPEHLTGAHTKGYNQNSLGVCLTGGNYLRWYPSEAQYETLHKVLLGWEHSYGKKPIYFHKELSPTKCPGRLDKGKVLSMFRDPEVQALADLLHHTNQSLDRAKDELGRLGDVLHNTNQVVDNLKLRVEKLERR